jgi:hypothetical protein
VTDTSSQAPPPSDPSAFATSLNTVLNTAPELSKSPGLSVGIASAGGDVQGNSQAVARGTNILSDTNAHAAVSTAVGGSDTLQHALDWFGNHVVADVGAVGHDVVQGAIDVGSKVLSTMNKPMQIVQHEYRYLHDVEATHGMTAALLEGLGIAGGAVAGAMTTGSFYGADLGAEAATGIESQLFYKDSWDRTAKASYADPNTHQQVSIGRDLTSELDSLGVPGFERNGPAFKITSGLIDGIFDMNVGGTELLGLAGKANSAAGLGGTLGDMFPGKSPQTTEAFDNLLTSFSGGNVRRAFADIASKNVGEIGLTSAYKPIVQQPELMKALGEANTEEEVTKIFRDIVRTHEMVYFDKLPTLSITRLPFQLAHEAMGDSTLPGMQRLYHATSRLPESIDDVTKAWTNKEFNPAGNDDGTLFVGRTALFTENRTVAAAIMTEYANADVPGKIKIWRKLVWSTLANVAKMRDVSMEDFLASKSADPKVQQMWGDAITRFIDTGKFGKDAIYGLGDGGPDSASKVLADVSKVRNTETGVTSSMGITMNQTGPIAGLDMLQARRVSRILGDQKIMAKIGGLDDFAFDHLTAPIFKRWVLMSPSYALHIALAELIPNTLRLGMVNMVRSRMEISAARIGMQVSEGDASVMTAAVWKLIRGARAATPGVIDRTTERDLNYGVDFLEGTDGAGVPLPTAAGHGTESFADDLTPRDEKSTNGLRGAFFDSPKKPKTGDNFGIFQDGHAQYNDSWQAALHEKANDDASQLAAGKLRDGLNSGLSWDDASRAAYDPVADFIRNMPAKERGKMSRALETSTSFPKETPRPAGMDQYDEWSHAVTDTVRGLVTGKNGTVRTELLDHIRNGETVDDNELRAIPSEDRPAMVKGRLPLPNGDSRLQRIANWGFRRVLNPMVDFLSREPIAWAEYRAQRIFLEKSVEDGSRTEEEAHVQAMITSTQNVIKNVHNLTDRTQWTETFRNWAPFYFAQEQAYRRMGRLLAEDPAAFRKYQLMISNMHDVGQVFQGKNGQGYFVMPGTGFLTKGVVSGLSMLGVNVDSATPVGMGWNLSSSSVIFPLSAGVRPDIGPLVSIAVSEAAQLFPETLSPVLKADFSADANTILGPTATEAWYEQVIPNTIAQRLLTAALPAFNARSFNSTMMQTLATLDYESKIPPAGSNYRVMQAFVDRVQNQTRILYAMKALVGAVTPVSPELTNPTYNLFSAELSADITAKKSVAAGLQEFLTKHPEATPFTVWQSSELTGMSVPSSTAAEAWVNNNYDLITRYPNAGILLMPTTGLSTKYNSAVYNEQIAQNLRSKLDPEQWTQNGSVPSYIDALYIAAGNSIFYKWLAQYEAQIKSLSGTDKYNADQAFWGNGTLGSGTIGKYAQQNPVWGNWFNSDSRETERGQAIIQMTKLLNENPGITSDIANNTRTLLQGYAAYQNQITTLTTDGSSSTMQTEAKDSWDNYLVSTATSDPEMINVITGLFMSIPTATAPQVNIANVTPGTFTAKNWKTP